MSEEKNETLADKVKAQIDTLKTKEGRDALKEKAKKELISATTTVKNQLSALKTKDGRSQFVANIKALPIKKKVTAGLVSLLVLFCLFRLPACIFGWGYGT